MDLRGRKVLIADDDRSAVRAIQDTLGSFGFRFAEAFDGRAALAAVRDFGPELLVMDVEMPQLSGLEVARILKADQGQEAFGFIPVILMTARGAAGKVEGLELGADEYLVKPVDPLELRARVKTMLRLKVLQDQLLAKMRELDQANRELERLSRIDGLTALFNRRYFEERFNGEFERSRRYGSPLACLMLDLDGFKSINDRFGHPFGDRVLRGVSDLLRVTLRDVDLCARYGGEELVAVLPETGPEEARTVAERVRRRIEEHAFEPSPGRTLSVTTSVGVACCPAPGVERPEDLLRAADEALYAAKARGRNRVAVAAG